VQSIFRHSQKRDVPELLSPAVPREPAVPAAVVAAPPEMWFQIKIAPARITAFTVSAIGKSTVFELLLM
jgi:hypothetical protein